MRDALAWSNYLNEAVNAFGDKAEVMIAQHHWPVFGHERLCKFLIKQRNLYKYEHDQTLRLLNQGFTAPEIAERLQLPASLANEWEDRDYYGTVRQNAKAIYQRYLGWYDGNPANLDPLPPVEEAKKYVAYMGGASAVIRHAREDYKNGAFRFVAEVANKLVFADPGNQEARDLAADAYEQLGYLSESGTWRMPTCMLPTSYATPRLGSTVARRSIRKQSRRSRPKGYSIFWGCSLTARKPTASTSSSIGTSATPDSPTCWFLRTRR